MDFLFNIFLFIEIINGSRGILEFYLLGNGVSKVTGLFSYDLAVQDFLNTGSPFIILAETSVNHS